MSKWSVLTLAAAMACGSSHDHGAAPDPGGPDAGDPDAGTPGGGTPDAPPDGAPVSHGGDPFAALRALPATCSVDQWCWRTPTPAGNDYDGILSTAPDNIWMIGQHGTVMQWDGTRWTLHHPPVPAGQSPAQLPLSITGRSASDVWLIFGPSIEHWDGTAWTIRDALPPNGTTAFDSIWEAPSGEVWVTMNNGNVRRSTGGAFQQIATGCGGCFLGAIWGTASDDFFITTLPAGILHYDGHAFVSTYQGPLIAGSYQGTHNDVWVAGADGALLHWNGTAWTQQPTGLDEWTLTRAGALASNDVWWWGISNSARSAFLHWDGSELRATQVDTTVVGAFLFNAAIIDGRWWLTGGSGAIYTKSGADSVAAVIDPQVTGLQSMWGSAENDMYFASGGQIRHWDGAATTIIPITANQISGVHTAGANGGTNELFATGFELTSDGLGYIADAFHFDGTSWTKAQLGSSKISEHRYFTEVFAMGPGEAMAVGYGGLAYHFTSGNWTPVATGVTTDLLGVWGPDPDHLWFTGTAGTLLTWNRATPDTAVPDPSLPATTDDLRSIHGAGGVTWIGTGGSDVLMSSAGGWTRVAAGVEPDGLFAIAADNVVVSSAGQSLLARWNGSQFVREDLGAGTAMPILFQPPGGPMLAGWISGVVQHP